MQAFAIALLTPILKWLLATGIADAEGWFAKWHAGQVQKVIDQANLKTLQAAKAAGDQKAIDQAAQNLLNGVKS